MGTDDAIAVLALGSIAAIFAGIVVRSLAGRPRRELAGVTTGDGAWSTLKLRALETRRLRLWVTLRVDGNLYAEELVVRVRHEVLVDGQSVASGDSEAWGTRFPAHEPARSGFTQQVASLARVTRGAAVECRVLVEQRAPAMPKLASARVFLAT